MKTEFVTSLLLLLFAAGCQTRTSADSPAASASAAVTKSPASSLSAPAVILPDGFRVEVEVAADDDARSRGLMYRENLQPGRGMLFLFPADQAYTFWMKNTLIPLDMIWIDQQKTVVDVKAAAPPCPGDPCPSYGPRAAARSVLELAAGEAAKHGVVPGARLQFQNTGAVQIR